jgi:hypothetical protein
VLLVTFFEYPFLAARARADLVYRKAAVLDKSGRTALTNSAAFFPDLTVCKFNCS